MARDPKILENINKLLIIFPYYGNFSIVQCELKKEVNADGKVIQEPYLPDKKEMFDMNLYLCGYGFAERRHDIDSDGNQIQLTDRGRQLKELGSIKKFIEWHNEEKKKEEKRINDSETLMQTNILSGKIQQSLLSINRWIALAGIVAAVYYLVLTVDYFSSLIAKKYPIYYSMSVTFYLLLLGVLIGACTTIGFQQWRRVRKKKQSNNNS